MDACLKDGYNFSVAITGITRSGTTATATVSTADGKKLKTGQILTISGAGQSDYNITAVITVASTTTFTYQVANSPTTPATGTISASSKLPITSITRGGTGNLTATATLTNINVTLIAGDKVVIEGAAQSAYNGTVTILTVTQTGTETVITYLMASDPGASASGTLTYYKAGLQWTHAAAGGTNSQSYVSAATTGAMSESYTPRPIQFVDNGATAGGALEMQVWAYESITSDQNGTARWPTTAQQTNGLSIRKSNAANTTLREWTLFGDEKTFCFEPMPSAGTVSDQLPGYGVLFGYVIPEKSGDAYNTILCASPTFGSGNVTTQGHHSYSNSSASTASSTSCYMPRLHNQAGTSIAALCGGPGATSAAVGAAAYLTYPMPSTGGLYTTRYYVIDTQGNIRGRIPGIHIPLHNSALTQYDLVTNNAGLPGVTLRCLYVNYGNGNVGQFLYDVFGPWT